MTLGYRYIGGSAEKLAAFLNSEIAKWPEVAKRRLAEIANRSSLARRGARA